VLSPTWPRFITKVDIFNTLIASSSAIKYIREITISDIKDFDLICPKALKASRLLLILFKN